MVDSPLDALLAWREDQLGAGTLEDDVPLPEDLELIATTPGLNRAMLESLPLHRPDLVRKFAPGVLSTLRTVRAAADVGGKAASTTSSPWPSGGPAFKPLRPAEERPPPPSTGPTRSRTTRRRTEDAPGTAASGTPGQPNAASGPLKPDGFVPFDIAAAGTEDVPAPRMTTAEDGSIRVTWDAVPHDGVVIYRVVTRDDFDVWSPDEAALVAVTREREARDTRPFEAAARFYAVWAHLGDDEASARAAQPRLLAKGAAVAPPFGVQLQEDHGTVIASWQVARGVHRVDLLRVPSDQAQRSGYVSQFKIGEASGRSSFQDLGCTPGQEYEYRLFAVRADPATGEEAYSDPVRRTLRISTMLTPVEEVELLVRTEGPRTLVDVSWQQPATGTVVLYRTPELPLAGALGQDLPVDALPAAGLADEHRLPLQPDVTAGRAQLHGIAWPEGWSRTHFTAVTISGPAARIGATATRSRTSRVEQVRLVQRVHWQLLTFSWPPGAVSVAIYQTPVGTTLDDYPTDPIELLSEADYRRAGGARLRLPSEGCDVHLVPLSFFERKQVAGTTTTHHYPGLFVLEYRLLAPQPAAPTGRFGRRSSPAVSPTQRLVEVRGQGQRHADEEVALTLVAQRDRWPLSAMDAEQTIGTLVVGLPGEEWTQLGDIDVAEYVGWHLRMFAVCESRRVAVLDPELSTLLP